MSTPARPLDELETSGEFIARHIGPEGADEAHMLSVIGAASRQALIDAIVPRVVRKRSRSWVTARPDSSMDSFMISRGLRTLRRPAARTRPRGEVSATRLIISGVAPV